MRKYVAGFVLIFIGLLFLAADLNLFNFTFVFSLLTLWPMFLIFAGLGLIFKGTLLAPIGSILSLLLIVGLLSLGILANLYLDNGEAWTIGPLTIKGSGISLHEYQLWWQTGSSTTISEDYELPANIRSYSAKLDFGAGTLNISGSKDKLLTGQLEVPKNNDATVSVDTGKTTEIKIKPSQDNWLWFIPTSQNWDLQFADNVTANFDINTGAATANLDFSDISINKLSLDTGASTTNLTFGLHEKNISADIDLGAATLNLRIPNGMGVYLRYDAGLSTLDLPDEIGKQDKNIYKSSDYDNADYKIDITLKTGVSNVNIEYYEAKPDSRDQTKQIEFDRIKSGSHTPYPYDKSDPHLIVLNQIASSDEETPIIDLYDASLYDDELVLLLLQGKKNTGGYRIKTDSASLQDNILTIEVEITEPSRRDLVTQSTTSPYDLISIKKEDLSLSDQLKIVMVDQNDNTLDTVSYLE